MPIMIEGHRSSIARDERDSRAIMEGNRVASVEKRQGRSPCTTFDISENYPTNERQLASSVFFELSIESKFPFVQPVMGKSIAESMMPSNSSP